MLRYGIGVKGRVREIGSLPAVAMFTYTSLQIPTCNTKSSFLQVTFEDNEDCCRCFEVHKCASQAMSTGCPDTLFKQIEGSELSFELKL